MTSRKRKDQKLRHEVSEYTSLIRALQTTSAQDIVPHLTGSFVPPFSSPSRLSSPTPGPGALGPSNSPESSRGHFQHHQSPGESSEDVSDDINRDSSRTNSDISEGEPRKNNKSNHVWTRWPLLQSDVYVPEWTLQDEVKSIAEVTARKWVAKYSEEKQDSPMLDADETRSSSEGSSNKIENALNTVEPLPEEQILTKGAINGLTLESVNLLSHIFAALAAHRPAVDISMQSRLKSMDWEAVVNILGASATVDQKILFAVERKMQSIYGGSGGINVSTRMDIQRKSKRKLREIEGSLGNRVDLLHFTPNPLSRKRRGRNERRLKFED